MEVAYQSATDVHEMCILNRFCIFGKQQEQIFSGDVAKHNFIGFRRHLKNHEHLRAWPASKKLNIITDLL